MTPQRKQRAIDVAISITLRLGLAIGITTTIIGAILLLMQQGNEIVSYSLFKGEPVDLKEMHLVLASAMNGHGRAVIQLGILLMIATPVCRVALCIFFFLKNKDYLYVTLSSVVFAILIYSLFYRTI